MNLDITPLEVVHTIIQTANAQSKQSLAEYTQSTRLAPTVLIERSVMGLEPSQITALEQTLLSIYAGYYMTAVNAALNIENIDVIRILDQFGTERTILGSAEASRWFANESISPNYLPDFSGIGLEAKTRDEIAEDQYKLSEDRLNFDKEKHEHQKLNDAAKIQAERDRIDAIKTNKEEIQRDKEKLAEREKTLDEKYKKTTKGTFKIAFDNKESIKSIVDESNLAVGKLLEVKVANGDRFTTIPVNIVLLPRIISADDFIDISAHLNLDKSMKGRFHQWRSGQIKFFSDYLLCFDLIEANRKALMADKTGTFSLDQSRQSKGILTDVISGTISPNKISTMIIISKGCAQRVEATLGGKLSSHSIREKYFNNNMTMMLVVVDLKLETFDLYQRGIANFGQYTLHDIAANNKKAGGVDIESVLKAYKLGDAASL